MIYTQLQAEYPISALSSELRIP